jgi:GNAT superfamily N-acetyltransferase
MLFADLTLARRLETAEAQWGVEYAEAQAHPHPESGATAEAVAGGYAVYAGAGSPMSRAIALGLNGPVTSEELEQVEALYFSRSAPAQVDLCPLADASLRELLSGRGYRLAEFNNVWVQELDGDESFAPPPPGVRVREAGPAEAELWARTVAQGFAGQEEVTPAEVEIAVSFFHMASSTCFLAWLDGDPAGGGAMATHRGLAALFSASTLPRFRERGVQTALLHARLAFAVAAACDLVVVQTEPGSASQRNVERLGFRLAYTKMTMIRDK